MSERDISGYFYGEECEYVYLVTDGSEQNYKFIFKDDKIYAQDGSESSTEEFIRVVKKITSEFRAKIAEHSAQLESYEKIYAGKRDFTKFIKKHAILKYEIRKFQNKISHFYEALAICQNERPGLKKQLKNYVYEAGVLKNAACENAARIDDIYAHIQSLKNDKINRNIYILTLLSALFLPLNFITGFFGMNTNGMFLNGFQNGTAIVAGSMLALFATLAGLFYFLGKRRE